jgi:hypothetical protein
MKNSKFISWIITIALFLSVAYASGQSATFEKLITGNGYQKINDLVKTSDGYLIVGATTNGGSGQKDVLIAKLDINCDTVWSKTIGGTGDDEAFSIAATSDSAFVIAGYTNSFSSFSNDLSNFYIIKIEDNGNILWAQSVGSSGKDVAHRVIELSNHNYVIAGTRSGGTFACEDILTVIIDSLGNIVDTKSFGANGCEFVNDIIEMSDGYMVLGNTTSFNDQLIFATKIDSNGNISWTKTYNFSGTFNPKSFDARKIIHGYTNDFVFTGVQGYGSIGDAQTVLISIDSSGLIRWSHYYTLFSGAAYGCAVDKTGDNGYIIGGDFGTSSTFLIKTSSNGNAVWANSYNTPNSTFNNGKIFCTLSSDEGFISAGLRSSNNDTVGYILKTDVTGNVGCTHGPTFFLSTNPLTVTVNNQNFLLDTVTTGSISGGLINHAQMDFNTYCSTIGIDETNADPQINCYPNPFTNEIRIETPWNEQSEIIIYDPEGRILIKRGFKKAIEINTSTLSNGIYFYNLKTFGKLLRGKIEKY